MHVARLLLSPSSFFASQAAACAYILLASMRINFSKVITTLGLAILAHTTYAVIKHRELLKLMQEEYDSLPPALLLELTVGLLVSSLGAFTLAGPLRPVVSSKLGQLTDAGSMRLDFVGFNTRAKAFNFDIGVK